MPSIAACRWRSAPRIGILPLWIDSKNQVCKSMSHNIIEVAVDIG